MLLFILLLCIICHSQAQVPPLYKDLFVLDCKAGMHLFPSHPILNSGIAGSRGIYDRAPLVKAAEKMISMFKKRAQCHCPQLTQQAADDNFIFSIGNFLKALSPSEALSPIDKECKFQFSNSYIRSNLNVTLPSTCTYNDYMNGNPCFFQIYIKAMNINLQIMFQDCQYTGNDPYELPYISISCSGDLCVDFFQPCSTDDDCFGTNLCTFNNNIDIIIEDMMSQLLQTFEVFPLGESSCTSTLGNTLSALDIGIYAKGVLFDFFNNYFARGFKSGGYCALNIVDNNSFMNELINNIMDVDIISNITTVHIKEWNGVTDDGLIANSMERVEGYAYPFNDVNISNYQNNNNQNNNYTQPDHSIMFFHRSCDNIISFNPDLNLGMSIRLPNINIITNNYVKKLINNIITCRSGGAINDNNNNQDFTKLYNIFDLGFWLDIFENPLSNNFNTRFTSDMRSFISNIFSTSNNPVPIYMPTTCNVTTWENTGRCDFEYTQLYHIYNSNITLKGSIEQCSVSPFGIPKITLFCIGSICNDILQPYIVEACTSDANCPGTPCSVTSTVNTNDVLSEVLYGAYPDIGYEYNLYMYVYDTNMFNTEVDLLQYLSSIIMISTHYNVDTVVTISQLVMITDFNTFKNSINHEISILIQPKKGQPEIHNIWTLDGTYMYILSGYTLHSNPLYPCIDGNYINCVQDICSDRTLFNYDLFNVVMDVTGQVQVSGNDPIGWCQIATETGIANNMNKYMNNMMMYDQNNHMKYINGLQNTNIDVCSGCNNGCKTITNTTIKYCPKETNLTFYHTYVDYSQPLYLNPYYSFSPSSSASTNNNLAGSAGGMLNGFSTTAERVISYSLFSLLCIGAVVLSVYLYWNGYCSKVEKDELVKIEVEKVKQFHEQQEWQTYGHIDLLDIHKKDIIKVDTYFEIQAYPQLVNILENLILEFEKHIQYKDIILTPSQPLVMPIEAKNRLPMFYFQYGIACITMFDYYQANEAGKKLISMRPLWWQGYYIEAESLFRMQKYPEAMIALKMVWCVYVPLDDCKLVIRLHDKLIEIFKKKKLIVEEQDVRLHVPSGYEYE